MGELPKFPSPNQQNVESTPLYWYHKRTEWREEFVAQLRQEKYCQEHCSLLTKRECQQGVINIINRVLEALK